MMICGRVLWPVLRVERPCSVSACEMKRSFSFSLATVCWPKTIMIACGGEQEEGN